MTELEEHVANFMARFNASDLEGALADFSDEGRYIDEFGNVHAGKIEIRAAMTPIFDGSFGDLAYTVEETIVDPASEKALVTWTLRITGADNSVSMMRGLDILVFDGARVLLKDCYIKAKEVLVEPIS
ncbi:YybH family protein [Pseudohalioglobus lutimaris]|uniref:Nuclear transport factor 2 family protein n=1 Tax=Pseudohalioglobus lutimaris TaxID=1737061 RepID=A0A2N5X5V8_9GAMM|nr:nuclear transport factor 2 family protein [Pseudohalioglobus lutimaris]PLW69873.1 nuclear transport factor 2 family protein [Pseudohalioglobus lutimaris]